MVHSTPLTDVVKNISCSLRTRINHAQVRAAREFPEDLVRISIGIESADDLIADLSRAMQSYVAPGPCAAAEAAALKSKS